MFVFIITGHSTVPTRTRYSQKQNHRTSLANSTPEMDRKIWHKLPVELLERILSFLPLKTFLYLRSTCKLILQIPHILSTAPLPGHAISPPCRIPPVLSNSNSNHKLAVIYALTIYGRRNSRLPPGPYPFPIIGSLLKLGDKPHRSLASLSKRYGPLMSLKLGSRTTIVVSSPDIAKEFFHTHDISFSGRTIPEFVRIVDHDKYSVAWLPTGDQWRRLRRITREYLLSVQRLDDSKLLRQAKVQELLDHVDRCCTNKMAVNIGAVAFTTMLNILSKYMFSVDFGQYDNVLSQEFKEVVIALVELAGRLNLADFFPILKPFDPQGLVRRGNVYGKKFMTIIDEIIDQRLQSRSSSSINNDVLDSLLDAMNKDVSPFTRDEMRHLFYV
ncbi:hypothetical protein L2E82_37209 [Cichorium intybus]|uniref:Uncharacterized protein n=1 Tax=Cichorium intybus TaxID=13427 RepID=A0ACB9AEU7_CICIN|nr:hypothetical protein L2E82_37209 [Cichorium intybus]